MICRRSQVSALLLVCVGSVSAFAEVTINTVHRGWYKNNGQHDSSDDGYVAGNAQVPANHFRNYFAFNLSGVTKPVTNVRLVLYNPGVNSNGFASPQGTETFSLFNVSTAYSTVTASQSGRVDIWQDLGAGTAYGSITATTGLKNTNVVVPLNSAGVASVNAARGGFWVVGGAITTVDGSTGTTNEYLFASTVSTNPPNFGNGRTKMMFELCEAEILNPPTQRVCLGVPHSFTEIAASTTTGVYWRKNGTAINPLVNPSATTPTLQIPYMKATDVGTYDCVVTGDCPAIIATAVTITTCIGDFTCDGIVNDSDFTLFVADYDLLACTEPGMTVGCPSDFNNDGLVDDADFTAFVAAYDALLCG